MKKCKCGYYPTIIIPGIGQSKVDVCTPAGERVKTVWPIDIDEKELVKKIAPAAAKMMVTRKDGEFLEVLKSAVKDIVSDLAVNSEGVPVEYLKPVDYDGQPVGRCAPEDRGYIYRMVPMEELGEQIGEDHLYFFSYNSFGQPYETAKDLHNYIQNVKEQTGHDKVNIVPVSLGGSIATAYFDMYGDLDDIHRVCYFVPAANGSTLIADILDGKVDLDSPEELFGFLLNRKTTETIVKLSKYMPKDGLRHIAETLLNTVLDDVIVNCPGMWAVVPKERYEALAEKYLQGYGKGMLKAKTERFYRAQCDLKNILEKQAKKGVEIFSICGYNRQLVPIIKSDVNSDTVVDFKSASLGGYALPLGETFPDDYKCEKPNCKNKKHNHISPERTVDLSTSIFPDRVFCFSGQQHDDTAYNDVALMVSKEILTNDDFKDVYSDPRFPQFNGSRNIRKLKYDLLPKAEELLELDLHERVLHILENAVEDGKAVFDETLIENNDKASEATKKLYEAVRLAQPEYIK